MGLTEGAPLCTPHARSVASSFAGTKVLASELKAMAAEGRTMSVEADPFGRRLPDEAGGVAPGQTGGDGGPGATPINEDEGEPSSCNADREARMEARRRASAALGDKEFHSSGALVEAKDKLTKQYLAEILAEDEAARINEVADADSPQEPHRRVKTAPEDDAHSAPEIYEHPTAGLVYKVKVAGLTKETSQAQVAEELASVNADIEKTQQDYTPAQLAQQEARPAAHTRGGYGSNAAASLAGLTYRKRDLEHIMSLFDQHGTPEATYDQEGGNTMTLEPGLYGEADEAARINEVADRQDADLRRVEREDAERRGRAEDEADQLGRRMPGEPERYARRKRRRTRRPGSTR